MSEATTLSSTTMNAGEAADVIALKVAGERLFIYLFHGKYSSKDFPGARLEEVVIWSCGQAQKSVFRRHDPERLLDHMQRREALRVARHGVSRFERGDSTQLRQIQRQARGFDPAFSITIVQPGLRVADLCPEHLALLRSLPSSSRRETYEVPLSGNRKRVASGLSERERAGSWTSSCSARRCPKTAAARSCLRRAPPAAP